MIDLEKRTTREQQSPEGVAVGNVGLQDTIDKGKSIEIPSLRIKYVPGRGVERQAIKVSYRRRKSPVEKLLVKLFP